jgi:pilus assembly protein CpaC
VENTFILSGTVSDSVKVDQAVTLANAYAGGTAGSNSSSKVVNMLQVSAPQQVMLEVKMAEVSKNLLDKLGAQFNASRHNGGVAYAIASGFLALTGSATKGLLTITHGNTSIALDAQNKDGVVKILAEPNIMAISGQEGSFLAGGKIFIPISQTATGGLATVTLEEKEFGIGLKFTPTVLEDGLINLKVAPEVSELSETGIAITSGSNSSILPSFTTRRATTTVQLRDGQSFAIAGLIKNNVTETITRFPILGSIPILGALFRSSEFQHDKTELLFVITPRLVKPLPPDYILPTDSFVVPSDKEFFLNGKLEGKPDASTPAPVAPAPKATKPEAVEPDGFEMK